MAGAILVWLGWAVGLAGIAARIVATRRARRSWEIVAEQPEMRYSGTDPFDTAGDLQDLAFFSRSHKPGIPFLRRLTQGPRIRNVMWGTWRGREARIFDVEDPRISDPAIPRGRPEIDPPTLAGAFSRLTAGQDRGTYTCAAVRWGSAWPSLRIVPAFLPGRLDHAIDRSTIEFEWESFNRAFDVSSTDRMFAHTLVDARMMEALMVDESTYGFQLGGPWLMVYARRQHPSARAAMLDALSRVVDAVPRLIG